LLELNALLGSVGSIYIKDAHIPPGHPSERKPLGLVVPKGSSTVYERSEGWRHQKTNPTPSSTRLRSQMIISGCRFACNKLYVTP
jgi:hypothetical protein